MPRKAVALSPLFSLFTLIENAQAESNAFDITQMPQRLSEKIGLPVFACGILVSSIILTIVVLVMGMIAGKSRYAWIYEAVITFSLTGVFVAVGWYPIWMLGVLCLIVAFPLVEKFARNLIRG